MNTAKNDIFIGLQLNIVILMGTLTFGGGGE